MNRGNYIFVPDKHWWSEEELESVESFLKLYREVIEDFFSDEQIQELVEKNQWQKVFDIWEELSDDDTNKHRYTADVLAAFLWLLGIDFMSDLTDEYIEGDMCSIASCDIKRRES